MEKEELRTILFEQYFKPNNGINIKELLNNTTYITNLYKEFFILLDENIEEYDIYNKVDIIKEIEHNNKKYLIIKISPLQYIIIDLYNYKTLNLESVKKYFKEDFFINNFKEVNGINIDRYHILETNKSLFPIVNYYFENKETFNIKPKIFYKVSYMDAISCIHINLIDENIQLEFLDKNQYLYEQLYFYIDLTPSIMQDSIKKIGINKVNEIFSRIKDINIPLSCIPKEIQPNNSKKLIKIKNSK